MARKYSEPDESQPEELDSFELDPDAEKRPYIEKAGRYGSGQPFGGKVLWTGFVASCRRANETIDDPKKSGKGPGFDRDCAKDDYSRFDFRITPEDGGEVMHTEWQPLARHSGGKTLPWLRALGAVEPGANTISPATIAMNLPMEIGAEFAAPRNNPKDPSQWFTGRCVGVFSA